MTSRPTRNAAAVARLAIRDGFAAESAEVVHDFREKEMRDVHAGAYGLAHVTVTGKSKARPRTVKHKPPLRPAAAPAPPAPAVMAQSRPGRKRERPAPAPAPAPRPASPTALHQAGGSPGTRAATPKAKTSTKAAVINVANQRSNSALRRGHKAKPFPAPPAARRASHQRSRSQSSSRSDSDKDGGSSSSSVSTSSSDDSSSDSSSDDDRNDDDDGAGSASVHCHGSGVKEDDAIHVAGTAAVDAEPDAWSGVSSGDDGSHDDSDNSADDDDGPGGFETGVCGTGDHDAPHKRRRRRADDDDEDFTISSTQRQRRGAARAAGAKVPTLDDWLAGLKQRRARALFPSTDAMLQSALKLLAQHTAFLYAGGGCGAPPTQLPPPGAAAGWDIRCSMVCAGGGNGGPELAAKQRRTGSIIASGTCSVCTTERIAVWRLCSAPAGFSMCQECLCVFLNVRMDEHNVRGAGLLQCPDILESGHGVNCLAYEHSADVLVDLARFLGPLDGTFRRYLDAVRAGDQDVFVMMTPGTTSWTCSCCGFQTAFSRYTAAQRNITWDTRASALNAASGYSLALCTAIMSGTLRCGLCLGMTCMCCEKAIPDAEGAEGASVADIAAASSSGSWTALVVAPCAAAAGVAWTPTLHCGGVCATAAAAAACKPPAGDSGAAGSVASGAASVVNRAAGARVRCPCGGPRAQARLPCCFSPAMSTWQLLAVSSSAQHALLCDWMQQRQSLTMERFSAAETRFLRWALRAVITHVAHDPLSRYLMMDAGIQKALAGSSGGDGIAIADGDALKAASSVICSLTALADALAQPWGGVAPGAAGNQGIPAAARVFTRLATRQAVFAVPDEAAETLHALYEGGIRQLCPTCAKTGFKNEDCLTITCCSTKWCYICARVYHEGIAALPGAARMATTTGPLTTVPHKHACPFLLERGDMADTESGVLVSPARATELFHVARHGAYVYCMMLACGDNAGLVPLMLGHDQLWMMWWRQYHEVPFMCDDALWEWRQRAIQAACAEDAPAPFVVFARALTGCEGPTWLRQYALAARSGMPF